MTLDEVKAVLIPVALALRADFDPPTQRAYQRVLKDTPAALVVAGIEQLLDAGPTFMPNAPEIQVAAEKARRQLLALHPYDGCADCEDHIGYRNVLTDGGQPIVAPCPCKARHRAKLAGMGLMTPVVSLPGEGGAGDDTVYPTIAQLPDRLQARLAGIAAQKVLR